MQPESYQDGIYYGVRFLHRKGKVSYNEMTWVNQVVASAFVSVIGRCENSNAIGSFFIGSCNPPNSSSGKPFSKNSECVLCQNIKETLYNNRVKLENEIHKQNSSYKKQSWKDTNIQKEWENNNNMTNSCRYACASCLFEENSQKIQFNISSSCNASLKTQTTAIIQQMDEALDSQITEATMNIRDQLNAIGLDVENMKTQKLQLREVIKNKLSVKSVYSELNTFRSAAMIFQETFIHPGTNSIVSDNNLQSASYDSVYHATQNVNVGFDLYPSSSYEQAEKIFEKQYNMSDLAKNATKSVDNINSFWKQAIGKLLVIIVCILLIVVLSVIAFTYFVKPFK